MAKNSGKIDIEMQKGTSNPTSFGGLCSVIKLFFKMGLDTAIDALIGARNDRAAKAVSEKEWKPLKTYEDGNGKIVVLQEWAEIAYAPDSLSTKKHGPDYRFFAVREKRDGSGKDAEKEEAPKKSVAGREGHGERLYLEGAIEALEAKSDKVRKLHLTQFGGSIYKLATRCMSH